MSKANLYKLTNTILSFLLGVIAVYYLYSSLKGKINAINPSDILIIVTENVIALIWLFILMLFNWGCELIKWNSLLKRIEKLSLKQLIESITLGVLLSMITPNRIGELGGRQLYISKENRLLSFYYQSFGALAQLLTTIIVGLAGLGYYFLLKEQPIVYIIGLIVIILSMIGLFCFSNLWIKVLIFVKKKWTAIRSQKLSAIQLSDRLYILFLSIIRYCIFSIQFLIIFKIFSPSSSASLVIMGLSITFLISAVIPTSWLSEVAVRSSIVLYVFQQLELEGSSAVISSVLLWIINLLIPALLGFFSLGKVKWSNLTFRKTG